MNFKAKDIFEKRLNTVEKLQDIEDVDMVEYEKLALLDSIAYSLAVIADHLTGAEQEDPDTMNNEFNTVEPDEK